MKKYTFLLIFIFSTTFLSAQDGGFLGKKNFISANLRLYSPIIYGINTLSTENFKTKGSIYQPVKNFLDYGINLTLGRALSRNFGVMIQFCQSRYDFSINPKKGYINFQDDYFYSQVLLKSTWLKAKATTIMPIIELTGSDGLVPLGLSHQFGLGFTRNELIRDDYYFQIAGSTANVIDQSTQVFNYSQDAIKSYIFMYKVNMRIPISNFLLFNIGFRYNINYFPIPIYDYNAQNANSPYLITNDILRVQMRSKEFQNIMSLETGLSLCF